MAEPTAFDKLVAAEEAGEDLHLDAHEVYELVADFCEIQLAHELDNHLAMLAIEELSGIKPGKPN